MSELQNGEPLRRISSSPRNCRNGLILNDLDRKHNKKRDKNGTSIPAFDVQLSDSLLEMEGGSERKKMFFAPIAGIHYREAKLTQGHEWFISFYVIDPVSGKLKRVRIKCNRERDIRMRRKNAQRMVAGINQRLSMGWNPLSERIAPRAAESMSSCLDKFLKVKKRELEANSIRSYVSFVEIFRAYLNGGGFPEDLCASGFGAAHAQAFMDSMEERLSPKTYNNYVTFFRGLFLWMQEKGYIDSNPFDGIEKKPKRLLRKNRRLLTDGELGRLVGYLSENNPEYLAITMLCYGCFIRPKEIALLRCGDIDIEKQLIHISADIAKNDNDSFRTIPDEIMPALRRLDLSDRDCYLFGDHRHWNFTPGRKLMCSRKIAKYWELVLREELGFGMDLKFYSLKDTGITNMLTSGVPINLVQMQADHSSVAMTAIYVGKKAEANNALKDADILQKKSSK